MDNWFTSYGLTVDLLKNYRLTLVATLRKNEPELFPSLLPQKAELQGADKVLGKNINS